jgi:hypothetical protein
VQNAVLAVVVGASLLGLSMTAAIASRRHSGNLAIKVALGGLIGALGAGIALVVGIDLIPDQFELVPATLLVIGIASAVIAAIALRHR